MYTYDFRRLDDSAPVYVLLSTLTPRDPNLQYWNAQHPMPGEDASSNFRMYWSALTPSRKS